MEDINLNRDYNETSEYTSDSDESESVNSFTTSVTSLNSDTNDNGQASKEESLNIEQAVDFGEHRLFMCSNCKKVFSSPRDLSNHIIDIHHDKVESNSNEANAIVEKSTSSERRDKIEVEFSSSSGESLSVIKEAESVPPTQLTISHTNKSAEETNLEPINNSKESEVTKEYELPDGRDESVQSNSDGYNSETFTANYIDLGDKLSASDNNEQSRFHEDEDPLLLPTSSNCAGNQMEINSESISDNHPQEILLLVENEEGQCKNSTFERIMDPITIITVEQQEDIRNNDVIEWICQSCPKVFQDVFSLDDHVKREHSGKTTRKVYFTCK